MAGKRIDRCPHCGSDTGGFTKTTYVNVPYMYGWDGEEQENGEMYDNTERFKGGRIVYCQDCRKMVCRLSTLQKQWEEENEYCSI